MTHPVLVSAIDVFLVLSLHAFAYRRRFPTIWWFWKETTAVGVVGLVMWFC